MYSELTIKEEAALAHESSVKRAAIGEAKAHVFDVIAATEQQLARMRWNADSSHNGKQLRFDSVKQSEALVEVIRQTLPELIDIDYQQVVQSVYDEDEQPLENEEYVVDEVRNYVQQLLKGLKVKP